MAIGFLCLGVLIGVLLRKYVRQSEKVTEKVLTVSVSVFSGAGVVAAFQLVSEQSKRDPRKASFYLMGLLAGYAVPMVYDSETLAKWTKRKV